LKRSSTGHAGLWSILASIIDRVLKAVIRGYHCCYEDRQTAPEVNKRIERNLTRIGAIVELPRVDAAIHRYVFGQLVSSRGRWSHGHLSCVAIDPTNPGVNLINRAGVRLGNLFPALPDNLKALAAATAHPHH